MLLNCQLAGVGALSGNNQILGENRGNYQLSGAFAEFERDCIRERVKAGLRNAKAKGKRLGRPQIVVDVRKVTALREQGRSWPQIAKQLGIGVGTAYRAHQELSKNPKAESLSRIPDSAAVAAD